MMYVLDASAALRTVLHGPNTSKAIRLRDDYILRIHKLLAPSIFPGEIASGLTKAERQRLIKVGRARPLIADVLSTPPTFYAYEPLIYRAVDISSQTRAGFYDCLYVALAEREGCEMVTDDDKLIKNVQVRYPFVRSLASLL